MILVFKTNIETQQQADELIDIISGRFPKDDCNFDLEDCDNVFRIETHENNIDAIILVFKENGFNCEELSDQIPQQF